MKLWKKILIGTFSLLILSVVGLYFFIQSLPDMCANEVLAVYHSPNNKLRAVIFQRDCGATTGFSTQVSVLSSAEALENKGGNIFVADTNHGAAPAGRGGGPELQVVWLSDNRLQIQYNKLVRIFRAEKESDGVEIEYATF